MDSFDPAQESAPCPDHRRSEEDMPKAVVGFSSSYEDLTAFRSMIGSQDPWTESKGNNLQVEDDVPKNCLRPIESFRHEIQHLYIDRGETLNEVLLQLRKTPQFPPVSDRTMRRYLRKWGLRRASDTSEKKHLTSSTLPAGSPGRDRTKSLENFGTLSAPGMDSLQDEPRDTRSQETSSREHKQVSQHMEQHTSEVRVDMGHLFQDSDAADIYSIERSPTTPKSFQATSNNLSEALSSPPPNDSVLSSQYESEHEILADDDYLCLLESESSSLRRQLLASAYPEYFLTLQNQDPERDVQSHYQSDKSTTTRAKTTQSVARRCSPSSHTRTRPISKRHREDKGDEHHDDDEPHRKQQKTPAARPEGNKKRKRLACLYHKHNPRLYRSNLQTQTRFEVCATHDFEDMHRLLEHLRRVHCQSILQCARCKRIDFASHEDLVSHSMLEEGCSPVDQDIFKYLTMAECKLLRKSIASMRFRGEEAEIRKWKHAYLYLFPGTAARDIPSPYLEIADFSEASRLIDQLGDLISQLNGTMSPEQARLVIIGFRDRIVRQWHLDHLQFSLTCTTSPAEPDSTSATSRETSPIPSRSLSNPRLEDEERKESGEQIQTHLPQIAPPDLPSAISDDNVQHDLAEQGMGQIQFDSSYWPVFDDSTVDWDTTFAPYMDFSFGLDDLCSGQPGGTTYNSSHQIG